MLGCLPKTGGSAVAPLWAPMICLLLLVAVGGCGTAMTPEQQAAMSKVSELGGKVNFTNGGYTIDLTNTPVEDEDLVVLKDIPKLQTLDLQGTRITNEGLPHIQAIESLQLLFLGRTGATREAIKEFKAARPNVDVRF